MGSNSSSNGKGGLDVSGLDTALQQGQFEFGPSQFDQNAITTATGGNDQSITSRYNQLGMGGSTPELADLANQATLGQATTGQEQNTDVTQPSQNPALQPAQTNLPTSAVLQDAALNEQTAQKEGAAAGSAAGSAASLGLSNL
jgi:hypothetical protein